jgi:hypothetical protein
MSLVALLVGGFLALAVGLLATVVGLDRDRAFYPTVMIVIAFYYVLFAVMGASTQPLVLESLVAAAFVAAAVIGFRSSLWVVVVALAAHGVFDVAHSGIIANPGVPAFWREFCLTYDVAAAGYLAWLLKSRRLLAAA